MTEDAILEEARELFAVCQERDRENRAAFKEDVEFARLEIQWDPQLVKKREKEGRPCLTTNKLGAFIRQVVNDARQNKPGIVTHPVDGDADPETAEVMNGLIRNIEQSSNADVAYDTSLDDAVSGGFGYFRINTQYSCEDTFDQDLVIEPIYNALSVYGDPYSTAADSSDWNGAFIIDTLSKKAFEKEYGVKDDPIDWTAYDSIGAPWIEGDEVMIAEYWKREQIKKQIVLLSDGQILDPAEMKRQPFMYVGLTVVGEPRDVMSYKVTQYILTGTKVLKTVEWAGKYIPIVPVYGDVINLAGKRYTRSLIRSAKDAQRRYNYHQSTVTELLALAPKAPWVGRKGFADKDENWQTANSESHAYLEYDGSEAPQRTQFSPPPVGELQAALSASDDMKSIIGLYDASLGARSNETSGKAINARQREGDVSTFHYIDNLSRAIRHAGRILIDLIPKVYSAERVVRVLGPDGKSEMKPVNQPTVEKVKGEDGQMQEVQRIYDLRAGKYDLTVKAGPSFTSQREEFVAMVTELIRAFPPAAPILGDMLVKNMDIPDADKIGKRLELLLPPEAREDGPDPAVQQIKQQAQEIIQQGAQALQQLQEENQQLKAQAADKTMEMQVKAEELDIKRQELGLKEQELNIKAFEARTKAEQPTKVPSPTKEAA